MKLLFISSLFTLLLFFISSVVHVFLSRAEIQHDLLLLKQQIASVNVSSIEKSIWDFDDEGTTFLVEGILALHEVRSVVIRDPRQKEVLAKYEMLLPIRPTWRQRFLLNDVVAFTYPLYQPINSPFGERAVHRDARRVYIGEMIVELDQNFIWNEFISNILYAQLVLFFLILSLFFIIERSFYYLFTRSLESVSKNISNIDTMELPPPKLAIPHFHQQDEIGLLANEFNNMLERLSFTTQELVNLASIDKVTGLPNRNQLTNELNNVIHNLDDMAEGENYSVVIMELDGFKNVNDLLGHAMGDYVLRVIAERIQKFVQQDARAFRLGGDEFILLFDKNKTQSEVRATVGQLGKEIAKDIYTELKVIKLTSSMGISLIPELAQNQSDLLKQSDIAMYEVKQAGGNDYKLYSPEMTAKIQDHENLKGLIDWAIQNNQFVDYYQPKICVKTQEVIGYEVLLRMRNKEKEIIFPDVFIPTSETTRQIIQIGRWVLDTSLSRFSNEFRHKGIKNLAINMSLIQLEHDPNFVQYAGSLLAQYNIEPGIVDLEITESFFINNLPDIVQKLEVLRRYGYRIAVDDFGTGYSSLSYLKTLPIDTLKIDRSFVNDLPGDDAMSLTIIALANNLGLSVVAEGVEEEAQRQWLESAGVEQLQGYLFGKPEQI